MISSHSLELFDPEQSINNVTVQRTIAEVLHRPATEGLKFLPEGPYPYGPNHFSWVAIQLGPGEKTGAINIFDWTKKTNQAFTLPGRPGFAFATDLHGTFVVGCEHQIGFFSVLDGSWKPFVSDVDLDKQGTIINDGLICGENLIFGTKDLEFKTRKAGLYLFCSADRKLIRLRDDQICSNGKAFVEIDENRVRLFDIDSPTRKIVSYEINVALGTSSEATVVVDLTEDEAVPDGMILTPDEKSCIVSMYNPNPADFGETRQYSLSDGTLEQVWITPGSPQNTCPQIVAFQGKAYLVITTAVEHIPAERRSLSPEAGSLFHSVTDFDAQELNPPVFKAFMV